MHAEGPIGVSELEYEKVHVALCSRTAWPVPVSSLVAIY